MPGLTEPSQVGAREDLSSYITNIEREETPLFTLIPKDTVNKTHFETQVDDFGSTDDITGVGTSSDVEDFDNMAENRGLVENYVMKMREAPMVDDFAENVNENPALAEGEYVDSVRKAVIRLKFRIEKKLLGFSEATTQADDGVYGTCSIGGFIKATAPSGRQTVPSRFRPAAAQIYSSTLASLDEEDVHDALQEIFEATHGAAKFTMPCGSELKQRVSSFSIYRPTVSNYTTVRHVNADDDREQTTVVDILTGDFGTVMLIPTTRIAYHDSTGAATTSTIRRATGHILNLSLWGLAFKRKPGHRRLEDQGGGPRGIVDAIFGLRCKNPKGNGGIQCSS